MLYEFQSKSLMPISWNFYYIKNSNSTAEIFQMYERMITEVRQVKFQYFGKKGISNLVHPPRWYFSNLHFCLRISTKDYWDLMCNDAFLDEIFNLSERKSRYVFHSGTKRKKLLWWKIAIRYLYGMAT